MSIVMKECTVCKEKKHESQFNDSRISICRGCENKVENSKVENVMTKDNVYTNVMTNNTTIDKQHNVMTKKHRRSFRLSDATLSKLDHIRGKLGLDRTKTIEYLILHYYI